MFNFNRNSWNTVCCGNYASRNCLAVCNNPAVRNLRANANSFIRFTAEWRICYFAAVLVNIANFTSLRICRIGNSYGIILSGRRNLNFWYVVLTRSITCYDGCFKFVPSSLIPSSVGYLPRYIVNSSVAEQFSNLCSCLFASVRINNRNVAGDVAI